MHVVRRTLIAWREATANCDNSDGVWSGAISDKVAAGCLPTATRTARKVNKNKVGTIKTEGVGCSGHHSIRRQRSYRTPTFVKLYGVVLCRLSNALYENKHVVRWTITLNIVVLVLNPSQHLYGRSS